MFDVDVFLNTRPEEGRQLFLDSDGVLANFDGLAFEILGMDSQEFEDTHGSKLFWKKLHNHGNFFGSLEKMPDADALWELGQRHNAIVLTGCPSGDWAPPQKRGWYSEQFNTDRIITCKSREKRNFARPGDVLVDDLLKYRHLWEEMGGIFVHHVNLQDTLDQLRELGIE